MKTMLLSLFFLSLANAAHAGGEFFPGKTVVCKPFLPSLLASATVEVNGSHYQTRFQFNDGHVEVIESLETNIQFFGPRLIMGRESNKHERVKGFEIASPNTAANFSNFVTLGDLQTGEISTLQVHCEL